MVKLVGNEARIVFKGCGYGSVTHDVTATRNGHRNRITTDDIL